MQCQHDVKSDNYGVLWRVHNHLLCQVNTKHHDDSFRCCLSWHLDHPCIVFQCKHSMQYRVSMHHVDKTRLLYHSADSRLAPSQWQTALLCNDISHWLGASLESAMYQMLLSTLQDELCGQHNWFSSMKKLDFDQMSPKLKIPIKNKPALLKIMACRSSGRINGQSAAMS